MFANSVGTVLEKYIPDHRPILLKERAMDYGPTPFRFFNSWLEEAEFNDLVKDTWINDGVNNDNALVKFKNKLKNLKNVIRA